MQAMLLMLVVTATGCTSLPNVRNRAFEAIAAYSDSLEAIVSSGNQGAQAGSDLADSIQEFAEAAGVTAHKQVVNALKNRRPVSTTSLLEAAVEIQYLIKSVREL